MDDDLIYVLLQQLIEEVALLEHPLRHIHTYDWENPRGLSLRSSGLQADGILYMNLYWKLSPVDEHLEVHQLELAQPDSLPLVIDWLHQQLAEYETVRDLVEWEDVLGLEHISRLTNRERAQRIVQLEPKGLLWYA